MSAPTAPLPKMNTSGAESVAQAQETERDMAMTPGTEPKRWSQAAENKLRRRFLAEVRASCDDSMRAYTVCAKEAGFFLPFRSDCRALMWKANDCVKEISTDAHWEIYKHEKKQAWIDAGVLIPDAQFLASKPNV